MQELSVLSGKKSVLHTTARAGGGLDFFVSKGQGGLTQPLEPPLTRVVSRKLLLSGATLDTIFSLQRQS